jgi:hypothetical protein
MNWFVRHAKARPMTAVPAVRDPHWTIAYVRARGELAEVFERAGRGHPADRNDVPRYRLRPGVTLRPEHVLPGDVEDTLRQVAVLREVRADHPELAETPLLVPVPHPVELALLTHVGPSLPARATNLAGARTALRHLPVYVDAVVQFITAVTDAAGDDVLFGLDMPTTLVGMWTYPFMADASRADARWHAGITATLLTGLPRHVDVILQLGFTDDHHVDALRPTDLSGVAHYLNRLARRLRRLQQRLAADWRRLPPVYVPVAFNAQPPSPHREFYAALTTLDAEWDRLIPGVAHGAELAASHVALARFEIAAGRESYAVAPGCGRLASSVREAEDTVRVQRDLVDAKRATPAPQPR